MALPMVAAACAGIPLQFPHQKSLHSVVRITADTAINRDPSTRQSVPGPAADTAANQRRHPTLRQKARQSPMPGAIGFRNKSVRHPTLFHFIDLTSRGMSKLLKHQPIPISNRNFHNLSPFYISNV